MVKRRLDLMLLVLVIMAVCVISMPAQSVVYVDKMAPRTNGEDGLSWATAFDTIQEGIDLASSLGGDEVWVAGGPSGGGYVYNEDRPNTWGNVPVSGSLIVEDNVRLYGGFEGYWGYQETDLSQRNPRLAVTIIDGSVSRGGAPAYHVIVVGKETGQAVNIRIDGFQITGGNASGVSGDYHTWRGGGLYNYGGQVTVANCTFIGNVASVSGGAIANEKTPFATPNLVVENCVFYQNTAQRQLDTSGNPIRGGGAIFSNQADVVVAFSTFVANTVDTVSGGLYGLASGGFFGYNTTNASIFNSCIFWDNTPAGVPCVEVLCGIGAPSGCGLPTTPFTLTNQTTNPIFTSSPPEFELSPTSPFYDSGDASYGLSTDIRMVPRPQDAGKDRGAYETVTANLNPVCKDEQVYLDNTGHALVPATTFADLGASSIPGGLWRVSIFGNYIYDIQCGMGPGLGVFVRFTENTGRWVECTSSVTVIDPIPPTVLCKNITVTLSPTTGDYLLGHWDIDNGSYDNCPLSNFIVTPNYLNCSNLGSPVPVQYTIIDFYGNTGQCTAFVTVIDNTPPHVTTKSQITVQLDSNGTSTPITPGDVLLNSWDNCSIASMSLSKTTFTCSDVPWSYVILTATDSSNNSTNGFTSVQVVDPIPPTVLTQDISVDLDMFGHAWITPSMIDNGSFDNCSITNRQVSPSLLTCNDLGVATVNLFAYDQGGNVGVGTATVFVNDPIAPTVITKNPTLYLDSYGQVTVSPSDVDDGSYDNCVIDHTVLSIVKNTFTCNDVGSSYPASLTVFDTSGNSSTGSATVTILDASPPLVFTKNITVDLDENGQATIAPEDVDDGSTDNCGIDHMELNQTTFDCTNIGTIGVSLMVWDVNGNPNGNGAIITVRDVTPPQITVTGSEEVYLKIGVDCYTELGATWTDACDGSGNAIVGGDPVPNNCPLQPGDLGIYIVTYDYTDSSGNSAQQKTRTVHVVDNYPPVINLLGDNPLTLDCHEPYIEPGYTATDVEDGDLTSEVIVSGTVDSNTPGTYIIQYQVTDHDPSNPQTTLVQRTVIVADHDLPVLTLFGPSLLAWQAGTPWVDPGYSANDDCWGDVSALVEITGTVDTNTPGSYILSYTPKDGSGNSGVSQQRTVYVGDLLQIIDEYPDETNAYVDYNTFELTVNFTGGIFIPGYDTFTWYRNSDIVNSGPLTTGMNTIELVVDPSALAPGTYGFYAELKDVETNHVSGIMTVNIGAHLSITQDISDADVIIGDNYAMTLLVTGGIGELHYQWQKQNGAKAWENIVDGGNISGSQTNTLVFTPFEEGDGGQYRCIIYDDYTDMISSNVATLTEVTGIPVAGVFGLSVLTALSALAGTYSLRHRKKQ